MAILQLRRRDAVPVACAGGIDWHGLPVVPVLAESVEENTDPIETTKPRPEDWRSPGESALFNIELESQ